MALRNVQVPKILPPSGVINNGFDISVGADFSSAGGVLPIRASTVGVVALAVELIRG